MRGNLRNSGIDIVGYVPWGTHICQFYNTKEDLTDILIPYFKAGLENNELCLWVTSYPLGVEAAKDALRGAIPDLNVYLEKEQIEIIPYSDWFIAEGVFNSKRILNSWVEKLLHASDKGYDGMRLSGNTFWLEKEDWNNFVEYKRHTDNVIDNFQMLALCTYSLERHDPAEIIDLVVNHQLALIKREGKWKRIESSRRREAEKAVIQVTKNWEQTLDIVPDLIAILDNEYRIVRVNRALTAKLNLAPEKCVGLTCYSVIHGTNEPPTYCPYKILLKEGLERTIEYREDRLGGDFIVSVSPLHDSEGNLIGCIHISRDITEHKKAEETLKKAHDILEEKVKERTAELEAAYKSLLENERRLNEAQKMAHIGFWDWDLITDEMYWSDEMYRIFGYMPRESSSYYNNILCRIHPDDRDYVYSTVKRWKNGKLHDIDHRIILANGEERTVYTKAEIILDEKKVPARLKGITQDITESKKAEEKIQILANVVESSNDAIGTMSLNGTITSWNHGAEQVYSYSVEEILGKCVSALAPPNLEKETIKLIEKIKQGEKIHQYETTRFKKDGNLINVSITLSPVFDIHGKLTAVSFISRDVTERKRVEEKLRESEEKYRNIVETANEGILIVDDKATITYANKKLTDLLGYTLEESIGRSIWDFLDEEARAIVRLNLEKRWQGISESFELKLKRKDGSSLLAFVNAKSLFDKGGKLIGVMSMLTDITKRKEAEEALANIEIARKKEIHHRIKNNLQVISSLLDLQADKLKGKSNIRDSEVLDAFRESQDRVISMALIHEKLYKNGEIDTLDFSSYIEDLTENLFLTYRLGNPGLSLNMDLEGNVFLGMDTAVPLGIIINELVTNSLKHAFKGRDRGEIRIKLYREKDIDEGESGEFKNAGFTLTVSDNGVGIPENLDINNVDTLGLQLVASLVDQLEGEFKLKRDNGIEFTMKFIVTEKIKQHQLSSELLF
ncbi:MAG: hypothetical protein QG646_880 [Euryarchaeota archaeon]|nr:hypothetical protein [Euryarchaeota archaeon]